MVFWFFSVKIPKTSKSKNNLKRTLLTSARRSPPLRTRAIPPASSIPKQVHNKQVPVNQTKARQKTNCTEESENTKHTEARIPTTKTMQKRNTMQHINTRTKHPRKSSQEHPKPNNIMTVPTQRGSGTGTRYRSIGGTPSRPVGEKEEGQGREKEKTQPVSYSGGGEGKTDSDEMPKHRRTAK